MVYRLRKLLVLAAGLSLALILATGPAAAMFYLNTQIIF